MNKSNKPISLSAEEERLIKKYGHKIVDNSLYYYWDREKNGNFYLPFPRKNFFQKREPIVDLQANATTGETNLIEVDQLILENPLFEHSEVIEKNGKLFIRANKVKPGSEIIKNFNFIGTHFLDIKRPNEKVLHEVKTLRSKDLISLKESLINQIETYSDLISEYNLSISNILKVIAKETSQSDRFERVNDKVGINFLIHQEKKEDIVSKIDSLFQSIQSGKTVDELKESKFQDVMFDNEYVSDYLIKSTIFGVEYLMKKRDPLIKKAVVLSNKYTNIEAIWIKRNQEDDSFIYNSNASLLDNLGANANDKNIELSKIEKVKLIIEVRNRKGISSFNEAIEVATQEAGQHLYNSYDSFKNARRDVQKYIK